MNTNWLSILLTYLPVVLHVVTAVEATINAPGATKKQVVMAIITNAATAGEQISEAHVQAISTLVDLVVGTLKTAGVFTSSTPTPAVAAAA
jgi:hypothetical protein